MTTVLRKLAVPVVIITALASATVAVAQTNELRGAPSMRLIDDRTAVMTFATKTPIRRQANGSPGLVIRVGGKRFSSVKAAGRHGSDYKYTAKVKSDKTFRVGAKYTVHFRFAAGSTIRRFVKVHHLH